MYGSRHGAHICSMPKAYFSLLRIARNINQLARFQGTDSVQAVGLDQALDRHAVLRGDDGQTFTGADFMVRGRLVSIRTAHDLRGRDMLQRTAPRTGRGCRRRPVRDATRLRRHNLRAHNSATGRHSSRFHEGPPATCRSNHIQK